MYSTSSSAPAIAARIIAREYRILMRSPVPYGPPVQPVFTSQQRTSCLAIFSPSICAYTVGGSVMNGAPKHAENVATGSVMPRSVPATFAVYPEMKWYSACACVRREIGGSTPNASAVSMITSVGCPPVPDGTMLSRCVIGYAPRVFSVSVASSRSRRRVSESIVTFSRIVPNIRVVAKISGSASADRLIIFA